jgi:hypothetical protein
MPAEDLTSVYGNGWQGVLSVYGNGCATVSYGLCNPQSYRLCNCVLRLMEMVSKHFSPFMEMVMSNEGVAVPSQTQLMGIC